MTSLSTPSGPVTLNPMGLEYLLPKVEDVADLDAALADQISLRHRAGVRVVHVVGGGIDGGPLIDDRLQVGAIVHVLGGTAIRIRSRWQNTSDLAQCPPG